MKKKQITVLLMSILTCVSVVGCTIPGIDVMDGDGMINENPVPDPVKPSEKDNDDEQKPNDVLEIIDSDAIIDSFVNNESKAKFDHVLYDEDDYLTLDEMVDAKAQYIMKDFYFEAPTYAATVYFADIDCGNDGVRDLGIKIEYEFDRHEDYNQFFSEEYIFMVMDDELKCIKGVESYYRSEGYINEYGYINEGGSAGAACYISKGSFVNEKGEVISDYYCETNLGYSAPSIPAYSLTEEIREYAPGEVYYTGDESEELYTTTVYNLEKAPDYPYLTYDENYVLDEKSQKLYEQYDRDSNEWVSKNFFTITDSEGNDVAIEGDLKSFADSFNVVIVTEQEAWAIIDDHRKTVGLSDTIEQGADPAWSEIKTYSGEKAR